MGKKERVLVRLFEICKERGNFVFDNDEVRKVSDDIEFKNQFEVSKLDNSKKIPLALRNEGYAVVRIGRGIHKFIKGINKVCHAFEPIPPRCIFRRKYNKSVLNKSDSSESNMLSMAINHRLLHEFLYGSSDAKPKFYIPRRTKTSFKYRIDGEAASAENLQMEIDMVFEHGGTVTVFEGKNGFPDDFAVYQLYNPYRYYHNLKESGIRIEEVQCCYVLRREEKIRHKVKKQTVLRVYLYQFTDMMEMTSIKLVKNAQYTLLEECDASCKIQK